MNPDQPTPQSSFDYLNQIAPKQQKQPLLRKLRPVHYILGGVIVVLLLVVIVGVVNNLAAGSISPMEHLAARLKTTATIANDAQDNLKSTQLQSVNSNLKIYLTNTNRDISTPFKEVNVTVAKLPADIVTSEAGTDISTRLEDARLNAVFDRTYAREMAYQLDTILTLMKQISSSTGNNDVKAFLQSAYSNLQPTQESFANYNEAQ